MRTRDTVKMHVRNSVYMTSLYDRIYISEFIRVKKKHQHLVMLEELTVLQPKSQRSQQSKFQNADEIMVKMNKVAYRQ